jgi:uncharacterized protein YjdB
MHAAAVSREMMSFALRSRLALAFVLVCGISCGGAGGDAGGITGPPTVTPTAAQVTLAPSSIALTVGASRTLTAEVRNTLGAVLVGQSIVWTASDTAVLSVNGGTVTARKAGTASVIASVGSVQGSAPVTVTPVPVASVSIVIASANLLVGQTSQLTASTKDSAGGPLTGRTVTWSSSDTTRAVINALGLLTTRQAGTTTIIATSEGKSAVAIVTITPVPVSAVTITTPTASPLTGQTVQLTATTKDSAGATLAARAVTWSSGDTLRATVSATGLVRALQPGTVTITATSEGRTGTTTLTVANVPVRSVSVTPAPATVAVAQSLAFTAQPKDSTGVPLSGRPVAWASSDASIATVSATGVVTGVAAGSVTITATSEGVAGSSTTQVTAAAPPPRLVVSVSSLPAAYSTANVRIYNSDLSVNTTSTLTPGTPVQFNSLPDGQYTVAASGLQSVINGINYVYLPPAGQESQQVTIGGSTPVVVQFAYVQRTGAIAITASGLPAGTKTACTILFPAPGVLGIVGGGVPTMSGLTETVQAYGTGAATLTCSPVTVGGTVYEASPAQQPVVVPASLTPATATIVYGATNPANGVRLQVSVSGLPAGATTTQVHLYNADLSVNIIPTISASAPLQLTSLPAGQYTLEAGRVTSLINGIDYVWLPGAAQERQQITVGASSTTAVSLLYMQRTGAISISATGLPLGTKTACTLSFPAPGVLGITSASAITTSGLTETVQAFGTGAGTLACTPVTVNGVQYHATAATQPVVVPASTTPATATVTYTQ